MMVNGRQEAGGGRQAAPDSQLMIQPLPPEPAGVIAVILMWYHGGMKTILLRLPDDLHAICVALARQEERSLASWIRRALALTVAVLPATGDQAVPAQSCPHGRPAGGPCLRCPGRLAVARETRTASNISQ